MRVLVLGGGGFIGRRLVRLLRASDWASPTIASRRAVAGDGDAIQVDARDRAGLTAALRGADAVANCVTGSADAIDDGARCLADAAARVGRPRIVHFSSMAVYGASAGVVDEGAALEAGVNWYGRAKRRAEQHLARYADAGGEVVTLRPGCVIGPESALWVDRVGGWLQAGRIGDVGAAGRGWSNLVHVDDVARAAVAALRLPVGAASSRTFNLAAPDSPRWNAYFADFAAALGTPKPPRVPGVRLRADAYLAGPALRVSARLLAGVGRGGVRLPDAIAPSLLRLWSQEIRLDASAATTTLQLAWQSYECALADSVEWYDRTRRARARR